MNFTAIDISKLPAPSVVAVVDAEVILANIIERYSAAVPELAEVLQLESDPIRKVFELVAYDQTRLLTRVNSSALSVMLAFAQGSDLDHLAALIPLDRHDGEADDVFRARVQLAPEAFSVAGPRGGYEFHTRKADPSVTDVYIDTFDVAYVSENAEALTLQTQIFDLIAQFAALTNQPPLGHVHIYPLASETGELPPTLSAKILVAVSHDDIRPMTDYVAVKAPSIVGYNVTAVITVNAGPDPETVRLAAVASVAAYAVRQRVLGGEPTRSGIIAALHVGGVVSAALIDPVELPKVSAREVPVCGTINVTLGGA